MSIPKIIKKIRIYPMCLLFLQDKWLKKMSLEGWHLIDYRPLIYVFEKGIPCNKEYFSYSSVRIGDGYYDVLLRHPNFLQTYGVKKKKSKLNKKRVIKGNNIIEIDTNHLDIEKDIGYQELKRDRNKLYFFMTLRDIGVMIFIILLIVLLSNLR